MPDKRGAWEDAMRWLDDNCSSGQIVGLLNDAGLDEDGVVRVIARACAAGDPDARRWVLERQPEAIDLVLDAVNDMRVGGRHGDES